MEDSIVMANLSTVCRLCLDRAVLMTNIHDHEQLAGKIADFAELQIDPEDGLPEQICYKCLFKVEKCSKFRLLCTQSDNRLRQLTGHYNNENEAEHSNSEEGYSPERDGEKPKPTDPGYVVEDKVVMVVDPSLDYDSSDGEQEPSESGDAPEQPGEDREAEHVIDDDDIGRAAESFFKNVFMCQFCDRAFITYQECRQHELDSHDLTAPYACTDCGLVFHDRTLHIQHAKTVHCNDKPYNCTQCEKTFGRRSDLRKHSIVHTGIRPYQCQYCLKSFSRNTNLSKHLRIHSGQKPHVCPHCPRSFVARGDLERHVLVHSGFKPFTCRRCPLTFGRRDKLIKHEMRHGINPPAKGESNDSDNEENSQEDNMVISLDPYSNVLTSPNQSGSTDDFNLPSVPDHISGESSFANQVPPNLQNASSSASKQTTTPPKPKLISVKNKPKNIKCHQCPKRFATLDAYKSHMAMHMGLRNFQCKICFKRFAQKAELDKHAMLHAGLKPFACSQCDKTFTRKDKLRKHERSHDSGISNMPCIECGATFEKKADLVAHIKSHFAESCEEKYSETEIKKEQESSDFNMDENFYDLET